MSILCASNITCEKNDRVLFEDLDLNIEAGEVVFLKGENGAGKTSLMRILVGLSSPKSGKVILNQIDIHKDLDLASKFLVYAGHKIGLSGLLTPRENLQFYQDAFGVNQQSNQDLEQLLSVLHLEGLEDIPTKHLSAGQQRRVSLAKLWLNQNATLWVLDEPFTALDADTVLLLEQLICDFVAKGGAVLLTSHQTTKLSEQARVIELEYRW